MSVILHWLDAYGKKKRHLKRGFKTKKEAKLYEARLEAGVVAPTSKYRQN